MKKKLYEAGTEVVNVLCIYVVLMATMWAIGVARANPELGIGVMVLATFLNIMLNIAKRGHAPWKKRQ